MIVVAIIERPGSCPQALPAPSLWTPRSTMRWGTGISTSDSAHLVAGVVRPGCHAARSAECPREQPARNHRHHRILAVHRPSSPASPDTERQHRKSMPIADPGSVQQIVPGMLPARGRGLLGDHLANGEARGSRLVSTPDTILIVRRQRHHGRPVRGSCPGAIIYVH